MDERTVARLCKIERLMSSPVAGEAAAAKASFDRILARENARERLVDDAVTALQAGGFAVWRLDGDTSYITRAEDMSKIVRHSIPDGDLPRIARELGVL